MPRQFRLVRERLARLCAWGVKPRVGTSGRYGWLSVTFLPGIVVYADSTAGTTGPQLLYAAIGAGNLRAYVQGTDDVGHGALSN